MLKRDVTVTFAANIFSTFLSLCTSIIIARVLGPTNRGLLGLAIFIPSIAATFCSLGQGTVNMTFAGLYKDMRGSLFVQSLIVTLFGTVLSTLVICAFYFWLPIEKGQFGQLSTDIIWLTCLVTPISMLSSLITSLVRGTGRIAVAAAIQVAQGAIFLCLLAFFFGLRGGGLKSALALTALIPLTSIILSLWAIREHMTFRLSKLSGWLFKKSMGFGTQISLATFAGFLIYRIDQGILAYMVSAEQVGLYIVAVAIAEQIRLLPDSIATAFLPRLANELSDRQAQVPVVFRCTTIISIASMVLAGIVGIPAILLFYGRAYCQSIPAFLFLLPGVAVLGGSSILASDLASREKPKYSVWVSCTILFVNIVLNFALIPFMGIAGASLASTISYISAAILWVIFYGGQSGTSLQELIPRLADARYVLASIIPLIRQMVYRTMSRLKIN